MCFFIKNKWALFSDPDFKDLGVPKPLPVCEFEMGGPEGFVESQQITKDGKALATEAVDCKWYIRAPPRSKLPVSSVGTGYKLVSRADVFCTSNTSTGPERQRPTSPKGCCFSMKTLYVAEVSCIQQIYLRFLDYEMQNSNECKRNFVAVYDGSSSVEDLKSKFCSTVANDVMLVTALGVIRMWADESSRKSRFRILFTTFQEPPCEADAFFCHSNMCINNTLVCNGVQNCVYPWDENHCKVQIKQPRKKYIIRREDFDPTMFQEVFEPPHYELCTLRSAAASADLVDLADDFENYHKLRRSSSRCIHDHHCGSQISSLKGSRSNLSTRDATILTDIQPQPVRPLIPPTNRRSILVMKHSYSQDAADGCDLDDDLEDVPTTSHRLSRHEKAVQ
ncbi:hypothetical protein JZ751_003937, partial [Albula glossodonta]